MSKPAGILWILLGLIALSGSDRFRELKVEVEDMQALREDPGQDRFCFHVEVHKSWGAPGAGKYPPGRRSP